ncbi:MAG TPA: Fe-S cluster assembly protein HesB [Leucothrix sp.]|nr:Fe-S cluster assembly protein HesB [Leucothrix sp.]
MFKITDDAAKQIFISLDQMKEKLPLRVAIKVMPDGSFHYNMGFDDHKHETDKQFEEKHIQFVVDAASIPLITGMTMDYVEIDGKHEIIFLNPNDPNYKPPTDV